MASAQTHKSRDGTQSYRSTARCREKHLWVPFKRLDKRIDEILVHADIVVHKKKDVFVHGHGRLVVRTEYLVLPGLVNSSLWKVFP